ncbi:MAG: hypothetical protein ACO3EE_04435 [Flavobacteriales bacterium]
MKNLFFILSLFNLFLTSCNTLQNDSFNEKTLEEGRIFLSKNMSNLEMRGIRSGLWKSLLPKDIVNKENLESCLNTHEYFYDKVESTTIELSTEEQYFLEDLEYIEREMSSSFTKIFPSVSSTDSAEIKMHRLGKMLYQLRKENYYNDIFILTNIEGKDTTETIYKIKKMVESQIKLSCEANNLIGFRNLDSFNDSLSQWMNHCEKKLTPELKEKFTMYADSLGYADRENTPYSEAKLMSDIQLLNLKMREMIYNGFSFNVALNARVNIKLLQKKE